MRAGARGRGRGGIGLRTELRSGVGLRGSNIKSTVMLLLGLGLR